MEQKSVIIVGGGASGLVAAIAAARQGAHVVILEQKESLGKKLLATGNGRCNYTNTVMETACYHGDDVSAVETVFNQYGRIQTMQFFSDLGVIAKEKQGYIYPASEQATTIVDVLRIELKRCKVKIFTCVKVKEIRPMKYGFQVITDGEDYKGDVVILATGGKAAKTLGSDGSGYQLAKSFGHTIVPVVPALVALQCKGDYFKQIAGVRTEATVRVFVQGTEIGSDTGELQLTKYGISGIPVFQISHMVSKALYYKKEVSIHLDFMPTISEKSLIPFFKERQIKSYKKSMSEFLIGIFNQKLIPVLLQKSHINLHKAAKELTDEELDALIATCKNFPIEVLCTNGFEQAQVCAGGVATTEIHLNSMESLLKKNLYLTGELLDVDGVCGGYNLQWAWSTGYIAGTHAARGE
ncbi:MAG: NAD(P)/FAD-dependent oxidoreductase [Lachnospiraceae bacterium]